MEISPLASRRLTCGNTRTDPQSKSHVLPVQCALPLTSSIRARTHRAHKPSATQSRQSKDMPLGQVAQRLWVVSQLARAQFLHQRSAGVHRGWSVGFAQLYAPSKPCAIQADPRGASLARGPRVQTQAGTNSATGTAWASCASCASATKLARGHKMIQMLTRVFLGVWCGKGRSTSPQVTQRRTDAPFVVRIGEQLGHGRHWEPRARLCSAGSVLDWKVLGDRCDSILDLGVAHR